MKYNEYKLITDYNKWRLTHPKDVYAITDKDGEFLFDVYEDDFVKMVAAGICSFEGDYHLLGNPTDEQVEGYAKEYGIFWTDLK